jgi:hypothetical protein
MSDVAGLAERRIRAVRRFAVLPLAVAAGVMVAGGLADAASPAPGSWSSKHARFTVNAKMTRVTDFTSKCAGYPLPLSMKIKANGSFSYKAKKGLMGGTPQTEKVKGKFTSATTASVTASYGRCHEKFTARTKIAPVETAPTTDTTETNPPTR